MIPLIIFLTAFVSTTLSSMSGGGASIINIPVLLFLGVPLPLASAAQKVSSAFWVLPAAYNFLKDRKIDWIFLSIFSLVGLIGVYFGVLVVLKTDQRILEVIIGCLILLLVAYTYFKKDVGLRETRIFSEARRSISYAFALIFGFYESIFGSGNGIMFAIVTFHTRGFDFIDALGYYFSAAFPWVVFAALLFISKGHFALNIFIPIVLGSLVGGYVGSKYAKYKGNRFIKTMFTVVGGILGIKLLIGF